ncbi:hypothetical protein [Acinetobacter equi]|uniref:Uncharacterized protein n=1 Tax=Acinetobacter equi TaxID=1324350 RepID=A0A0N9W4U2_9GAMM|nr:hypothetical protein [Acinetobacter equi]ALH96209.1 hypothetical protein AOY20_12060 [Acinetobacter equi]
MLQKLKKLFPESQKQLEQKFLDENGIQYDQQLGYIIDGVIMNELSARLEYFTNRRMTSFNDLKALYLNAIIINEKIDLEIANNRFIERLGNTKENLLQFKEQVKRLNEYYRQFLRDKR